MPVLGAGFGQRVLWLFDLDNTLHDARLAVFPFIDQAMAVYIADSLSLSLADADVLRYRYWQAYGATLKGLVRHHGVNGEDFLAQRAGVAARVQPCSIGINYSFAGKEVGLYKWSAEVCQAGAGGDGVRSFV